MGIIEEDRRHDVRVNAEKISFKLVPETCPIIDKALDEIVPGDVIDKTTIESLRKLIKSQTMSLRELSFKYITSSIQ